MLHAIDWNRMFAFDIHVTAFQNFTVILKFHLVSGWWEINGPLAFTIFRTWYANTKRNISHWSKREKFQQLLYWNYDERIEKLKNVLILHGWTHFYIDQLQLIEYSLQIKRRIFIRLKWPFDFPPTRRLSCSNPINLPISRWQGVDE